MSDQSPSDAELEALLREMIGDEPAPSAQREFAIAAFDLPRLDEELAELVYDSTSELATSGVRSGEDSRAQLSFSQGELSLDIEWEPSSRPTLTGQFEAPTPRSLTMHRIGSQTTVALDENGEFEVVGLETGPIRFSGTGHNSQLLTDWFTL